MRTHEAPRPFPRERPPHRHTGEPPRDWNVVVTIHGDTYGAARALLRGLGRVHRTPYYNVLVMKVDDGRDLLEVLRTRAALDPGIEAVLARVMPLASMFEFSTVDEFERRGAAAVLAHAEGLAGKRFHVRLHRRGLKGRIVSPEEERRFDRLLLDEAERLGRPAHVDFEDPDAILAIETVGRRAGVSLWTRDDRARHPLLHLD